MEIRTQEEYDRGLQFRQDLGQNFWVGATDIDTDNYWVWESNQEVVNLTEFWQSSRPEVRDDHNCAGMSSHGMFDYLCSYAYNKAVCEFD